MNKIFLIITIFICSYGHAQKYYMMGIGQNDCGTFLEDYDESLKKYDDKFLEDLKEIMLKRYTDYAHGVIVTRNNLNARYSITSNLQFYPQLPTLKRLLYKACNENLKMQFHSAVNRIYNQNAKEFSD
tara:strand:+ start:523 stop:906 length:384 start_codon:yes stop_codon:yes gene_type:complete